MVWKWNRSVCFVCQVCERLGLKWINRSVAPTHSITSFQSGCRSCSHSQKPKLSYSVYGYFRRNLSTVSQQVESDVASNSDLNSGSPRSLSNVDPPVQQNLSPTNLFIQGLGPEIDEGKLREMCQAFGEIKSLKVAYDAKKQNSRGFGFADFVANESALLAVEGLREHGYTAKFAVENSSAYARPRGGSLRSLEEKWKVAILSSVQTRCERLPDSAPTKYVLSMFPYPSGALHMGHIRVYGISDMIARFYALNGSKVIHPMGWDAFGLPAENAAIERGENPKTWTLKNIAAMRAQLDNMGFSFDWKRQVNTCDPSYYRWTQYLFLLLLENGLAYRKMDLVNWDPVDRTVLADEQVDERGRSWRSGAPVVRTPLRQWFIRTSRFAKSLSDGLDELSEWENIVNIQKNFIGTPNVRKFDLPIIRDSSVKKEFSHNEDDTLEICVPSDQLTAQFADVQFIVIRPSHPLNDVIAGQSAPDSDGIECGNVRTIPGIYVLHPSDPTRRLPVVVSDDEAEYGHKKFLSRLGVPTIINNDKVLAELLGLTNDHPPADVSTDQLMSISYLTSGSLAGDWPVSRQRFWGTPIPVIYCRGCGTVPLDPSDLPLRLPEVAGLNAKLGNIPDWLNVDCPKCGGHAQRETDTLDTFFDSSWYFLRYLDPTNETVPFDPVKVSAPVDVYIGGQEHACLHMYFARFMCHFLHSIGLLGFREPFHRLITQGTIRGETFYDAASGRILLPTEVRQGDDGELSDVATGQEVVRRWKKMSKSKHNGVSPDMIVEKYGADIGRLILLKSSIPYKHIDWNPETTKALVQWADVLLRITTKFVRLRSAAKLLAEKGDVVPTSGHYPTKKTDWTDGELRQITNSVIQKATWFLSTDYNTPCILARLDFLSRKLNKNSNAVICHSALHEHALLTLIILLHPLAPHFSAELWSQMTKDPEILTTTEYKLDQPVWEQPWPAVLSSEGTIGFFISAQQMPGPWLLSSFAEFLVGQKFNRARAVQIVLLRTTLLPMPRYKSLFRKKMPPVCRHLLRNLWQ